MEKQDSFERMSSGLSSEERQDILNRLKSNATAQEDEFLAPVESPQESDREPYSVQIRQESVLLRMYLWFKSIITSTTPELLYNEFKLAAISRNIEKNYPGLINSKKGQLLSVFYQRLEELKACAAFFRPYISALEEDEGYFYVFMGSLVMPTFNNEMNENVDPYINPITPEAKPELRLQLLHKMNDIFETLHTSDRQNMYDSVKSIEWLRQFIKLPFNRFLSLFSSASDNMQSCTLSQLDNEIDQFSKILCNGFRITDALLESLYLFSVRKSASKINDTDAGEYMIRAHSQISLIKMFMTSIPMTSLGKIIHADSHWIPLPFSGGEDWFVKYKNAWKRIFEAKWESWSKECHKEALKVSLKSAFNLEEFPYLPNRPWTKIWGGLPFRYELTSGFLSWYMKESFPTDELILKSTMVEGSFVKKENQTNFSDDFNNFIQISISFQQINRKLSSSGETGMMFAKLQEDHLRTLQAQTKVEQTMRTLEGEISSIIHKFGDASRSMNMLLSGILGLKKDSRYDSLTNLSRLQTKEGKPFSECLQEAKNRFDTALYLVQELENLDSRKY